MRAWQEAGFAKTGSSQERARAKLDKYADYLAPLLEKKQQTLVKHLALDQQELINEYMAISSCNPQDFLEAYTENEKGKKIEKIRVIPIHRLPRHLSAVIDDVRVQADGTVSYRLPSLQERLAAKNALGRHVGMFDTKLILEHRRAQQQKKADLRGIPDDKLAALEKELLKALGPVGAQLLGIQAAQEEDEEDGTEV